MGKQIFSDNIIELAKKTAEEMIANNDDTRRVDFARGEGTFIISKKKDEIIGAETITVKNNVFFIGILES